MSSVTVHFHGHFRSYCPDPVTVVAKTAAEAIDFTTRQIPGFKPNATRGRHTIKVKGFDDAEKIFQPLEVDELHIWPAIHGGGGNGGLIKIVIGVVLLIAAAIFQQYWVFPYLLSMGLSLTIGGFLELLSPAPKIDLKPAGMDPEASKYLGAGQNTVKIGTRIPLAYGRNRVYGHYISFNIDAKDVAGFEGGGSGVYPGIVVPADELVIGQMSPATFKLGAPSNIEGVTYFKITTAALNGEPGAQIFLADGTTEIGNGGFMLAEHAAAGFRLRPNVAGFLLTVQAARGYADNQLVGKSSQKWLMARDPNAPVDDGSGFGGGGGGGE